MLVMVVLALAGYFLTGFARRPDLLALTLIPAGPRDYFLGVEWTLLFEMTYYVVIAAMALAGLRRWLEALFVCWLAFIVGITITGMAPTATVTPTLSQLVGQSANIAFILGFLLPRFLDRLPSPLTLCALALPIALAGFWITDAAAMRWPTGLSSMLLVAAALKAAPPPGTGFGHRFGLRLGDASYALYLCHVPIIVAFWQCAVVGHPRHGPVRRLDHRRPCPLAPARPARSQPSCQAEALGRRIVEGRDREGVGGVPRALHWRIGLCRCRCPDRPGCGEPGARRAGGQPGQAGSTCSGRPRYDADPRRRPRGAARLRHRHAEAGTKIPMSRSSRADASSASTGCAGCGRRSRSTPRAPI